MNNKNKELISHYILYDIIYNYIKPELDKCNDMISGRWAPGSQEGVFYWHLHNDGARYRAIGSRKRDGHWNIYNNTHKEENVNIKIFNDHVEFIEDSKFTDFDRDVMYGLYLKIKEYVEGNNIKEENVMGVQNVTDQDDSNNKHVYILAIDACIDLPTYTFLIKAENKDKAFEIFWNRYKDFPEADIDKDFGASDFYDDDYRSIQRLHREKFVRIDENTMESKEEIYSTTSIRLCDAPKCVHIDDDITYIQEVY